MENKLETINKIKAYNEILKSMKALAKYTEELIDATEEQALDRVLDFAIVYNTTMSLIRKHGEEALRDEPMKFLYSDALKGILHCNGEFSELMVKAGISTCEDSWNIDVDREKLGENLHLVREIFGCRRFLPVFITVIMGDSNTAYHERIVELRKELLN